MMRFFGYFFVIFFSLIHLHPLYAQGKKPQELEERKNEYLIGQRDPIIIEVVKLDYANAEHLAYVLTPLLSKDGRMVPYRPTNSLIIKDRASIVKRLIGIIKGKPGP